MSSSTLANKKWRAKNPLAYKAEWILAWEVKQGRIVPQPCEVCGKTVNVHGHHDDYSKPLEVRWLCSYHHRKLHAPQERKRYIRKEFRKPYKKREHKIPARLPEAILLRENGKSYNQIAAALGKSQSTVYKWLNPNCGYK